MNTEQNLESILSPKFQSVSWSHLTSIWSHLTSLADFCEHVSVRPGLVNAGDHIYCPTESFMDSCFMELVSSKIMLDHTCLSILSNYPYERRSL